MPQLQRFKTENRSYARNDLQGFSICSLILSFEHLADSQMYVSSYGPYSSLPRHDILIYYVSHFAVCFRIHFAYLAIRIFHVLLLKWIGIHKSFFH